MGQKVPLRRLSRDYLAELHAAEDPHRPAPWSPQAVEVDREANERQLRAVLGEAPIFLERPLFGSRIVTFALPGICADLPIQVDCARTAIQPQLWVVDKVDQNRPGDCVFANDQIFDFEPSTVAPMRWRKKPARNASLAGFAGDLNVHLVAELRLLR